MRTLADLADSLTYTVAATLAGFLVIFAAMWLAQTRWKLRPVTVYVLRSTAMIGWLAFCVLTLLR